MVYGIITSTDIGALFIAGILPGILGIVLYNVAIAVTTRLRPETGPPGEATPWRERWRALGKVWGVLALFVMVLGGIYAGFFTPTEAAGMGATGAFLFAVARGRLRLNDLIEVLADSAKTAGTRHPFSYDSFRPGVFRRRRGR